MATLHLPQRLRTLINQPEALPIKNTPLADSLREVALDYPALSVYLFNKTGNYSDSMSIFINHQHCTEDEARQYCLKPTDQVELLLNLAGG